MQTPLTTGDEQGAPATDAEAKARADLGWPLLLDQLAARTHTSRGAAAARSLAPSRDAGWIRGRLAEVAEARSLSDRGHPLGFGGVHELEAHLARAEKGGHLDGVALREIATTLEAGRKIRRHLLLHGAPSEAGAGGVPHLKGTPGSAFGGHRVPGAPRLLGRVALLAELAEVSGPILDAFDDAGHLADGASPALGPLRRRAATFRDELDRRVHSLIDHPLIAPHLQDRFYTRREDRFVVPVRIDARARIKGIVHGTSGSGQTVFVEPEEIVDANNQLKLAELEVAEEERRILGELTLLVADAVAPIRVNLEVLAELDLVDAAARMAVDLRATEPLVLEVGGAQDQAPGGGEAGRLDLRKARHPLMVLSGRECVPNDLLVPLGGTLVVSGPNAGGKTVALKTAGLLSLMARAGLHLPAQEGSSLPLFHTVLTDVGDDQSIERNLSTFSAHVLHLNEFLRAAGPGALILLDEIAVGTDPEQGAALAQAVLERLAERGATVIVTTHYERLKVLGAEDARFANASVGFDVERLEPTYRLHLGLPGGSGAIVVARRLGLPGAIGDRAEELLGQGSRGIEELLAQVDAERRRLEAAARSAEQERDEAAGERRRLEELAEEARARLKTARRGEHDEAVEALKRARLELDRMRGVLRRTVEAEKASASAAELREVAQRAERGIDRAAAAVQEHAPERGGLEGRPLRPGELAVGMEVLVPRLGGAGEVASVGRDGKVVVQAGVLKLTVDESELLVPARRAGGKRPEARPSRSPAERAAETGTRALPRTPVPGASHARHLHVSTGNTLDLRGERVDAAVALAEKFVDDALRGGQDAAFLVHGHGTGALRQALREHFRSFPGVGQVRPGEPDEGGDAVTVVVLA